MLKMFNFLRNFIRSLYIYSLDSILSMGTHSALYDLTVGHFLN